MLDSSCNELAFKNCFVSRVKNYSLNPSENNALMPVFEAITNSLHGLQEKYEKKWQKSGYINIYVYTNEKDGFVDNIEIEDNGIGFNNLNFDSFITSDSQYKINKGGKGIGRFSWLKAFEYVSISSIYSEDETKFKRTFDFILDNSTPIVRHKIETCPGDTPQKTQIYLHNMRSEYRSKFPNKMDTVIKKALIHFLPTLIAGSPSINIISGNNDSSNVKEIFEDHKYNEQEVIVKSEEYGDIVIKNIMMDRTCMSGKSGHNLYFSANNRIVAEHNLNNQLGLTSVIDYDDKQVFYVGVVSGEYFDKAVFGERNNFDISEETKDTIVKSILEGIKSSYLKEAIDKLIDEKATTIEHVLKEYPRYRYMVSDNKLWAKEKLSPASKKDEDIFKELSVYDFRENKSLKKTIKKIVDGGIEKEDLNNIIYETVNKINEVNKSSLCEYVVKRKAILDILIDRLGYEDEEHTRRFKEEAIHKIVCPMTVNSNDIESMNHNLWIIDDRLAYYDFFASDKTIKSFIKESSSTKEPDLILFNGCTSFNRPNQNQPVVIVEFKRPERDNYTYNENPIKQIYDYIDDLRNGKVEDGKGRVIREINENTPFFCYIVCDITDSLKSLLKREQINQPLPGTRGLFGYNKDYNAYFEVLDFEKIIDDARLRNEAFFKKLGIN